MAILFLLANSVGMVCRYLSAYLAGYGGANPSSYRSYRDIEISQYRQTHHLNEEGALTLSPAVVALVTAIRGCAAVFSSVTDGGVAWPGAAMWRKEGRGGAERMRKNGGRA